MAHPIHLHGHYFRLLGSAPNSTFPTNMTIAQAASNNGKNPNGIVLNTNSTATRRDTAHLPEAGWMALRFVADNPGVWLLHCHINSHQSVRTYAPQEEIHRLFTAIILVSLAWRSRSSSYRMSSPSSRTLCSCQSPSRRCLRYHRYSNLALLPAPRPHVSIVIGGLAIHRTSPMDNLAKPNSWHKNSMVRVRLHCLICRTSSRARCDSGRIDEEEKEIAGGYASERRRHRRDVSTSCLLLSFRLKETTP